jgi:mono/diheme cytochrome c family protein
MFDFAGVGALVIVALLFGWLTTRAWRIKNTVLRWLATIPAALVTLIASLLTIGALVSYSRLNAGQPNPVREVSVAITPENIARGEKFARACTGCHTSNGQLPLTGNNFLASAPFGTFYAPNLTQAHFKNWSDGEIIRAIREGVTKSGRALLIMPSGTFHNLSDEDVQSIVAYLRSQGELGPDSPPNNLNILGALVFGLISPTSSVQPPIASAVSAPPAGVTPAYGNYLVSSIGCRECHGANFGGRVAASGSNGPPTSPSLLGISTKWDEAQFLKILRTGLKPDGTKLAKEMPYDDYTKFSDDDLRAIYAYLGTLKP